MKRMLAALLVLTLILGMGAAAMAEETAVSLQWSDYETLPGSSGMSGAFRFLPGTGLMLWIPDVLYVYENPEAGREENMDDRIASYISGDGSVIIHALRVQAEEGATLAALLDALPSFGIDTAEQITVNGMAGVAWLEEKEDAMNLMLEYEPGRFVQFMYLPGSQKELSGIYSLITASVQPENAEVMTRYWQPLLKTK